MFNVTSFSSACVKADRYLDYVPFVSTVTNLVDIFLKYVYKPCRGESNLENSHYFAYLDTKNLLRSIILLIPILGNIVIGVADIYCAIKAEEFEGQAANRFSPNEAENAVRLYRKASSYGSAEARFQLGCRFFSGIGGIREVDKERGIKYLRAAAALGHEDALNKLQQDLV